MMAEILDFFKRLFSPEGFIPRWYCGEWSSFHGWLYIISDFVTWLSYYAIPLLLLYFISKKRNTPFIPVFWWFIAFILFCGITHLLEVVIFWVPLYRLSALIKFFTAVISCTTVFILIKYLPKALSAKSLDYLERQVAQKTTQLTELNNKLSFEKMKLETIMDASSAGFLLFNHQGNIVSANHEASKIFGYGPNELPGQNIELLMPESEVDRHQLLFASYLKKPEMRKMGEGREFLGKRKNGKTVSLEIGLSPIAVGSEMQVLATIYNNEFRKARDEEKDKILADVNALNEEIMSKNAELEDVSYIVSHNLRSPIQNLKALNTLIADNPDDSALYLEKFGGLLSKLENTVNDLNEVIQLGRKENPPSELVNFEEVLNGVMQSLQVDIANSGTVLQHDLAVKNIQYPKAFIESYLQNVITNAIKYAKPGVPPHVTIKTKLSGAFTVISCEDNGIGIDLQRHGSQLFRFGKTLTKRKDSRGIGLYMLKRQIERLGGKITVESTPGVGSKFLLYLLPQA